MLIIDILKIKSKVFKTIVAIIMAVAPNFSATLMFFYCSDAYMIGMLLAVLAVFVVTKFEKNKFMPLLGGFFISMSMGMYQTYLSVTMVLFAALILIDLCDKEKLKDIMKKGLKYLITGIIGLVLYFIFMNLVLNIRQLDMNSYSGANEISLSNVIVNLPNLIPETYRDFFGYFFDDFILENSIWHTNLFNIWLFGGLLITIGTVVVENKLHKRILLILLMLVLLPICFCVIELISPQVDIHILMGCSFILFFPILFKFIELIKHVDLSKIIKVVTVICSICIIWIYIWQDNASYIYMGKTNEQLKVCMNRILTQIEEQDGYNKDMPIFIFGNLLSNEYFTKYDKDVKDRSWKFISTIPMVWIDNNSSWERFFYEYAGVNIKALTLSDGKELVKTEEFRKMGVFPADDSIKIINNTVVLRLQ